MRTYIFEVILILVDALTIEWCFFADLRGPFCLISYWMLYRAVMFNRESFIVVLSRNVDLYVC